MAGPALYDAGTAYLQIVPSFRRVERAMADEVAKMGRSLEKVAEKTVPESFRRASATMERQARKTAEKTAGFFATQFSRRVGAAAPPLPDIELTADTSDVDRAVKVVKDSLRELREYGEVTVDFDEQYVLEFIELLRGELEMLERETTSAKVRVDVRQALVELRAFEKAIGRTTEVIEEEAEEAGRKYGGAFGANVQRAVRKALESLPEIEIETAAPGVEKLIAQIRQRLQTLNSQQIGVDISGADALRTIRIIKAEIETLRRQRVDISVRSDAFDAIAALSSVEKKATDVDRLSPEVKVRANKQEITSVLGALDQLATNAANGFGRLGALIAVGASLGTVIVPAAAAAASAIGSIGTAAAAAAVGVGVIGLGLSGVSDAVKALNTFQLDSAKSATSLGRAQNSLAGALDGVRSAERSLSNTRANVAFAARRAAAAVVDAERGVAAAQREAREAQEDLTKAIVRAREERERAEREARRDAEDNALRQRDNALEQRQLILDVAEAKAELDKVLADPKATKEEREQASITYEQRKLQLETLQLQSKRLAEDQQIAAKTQVRDSDQVATAQERVRDTTEAVARAQDRLAEAIESQQEQQRQGAFQVEQAQQAVVAANRAVEQSSLSAAVAGGAAMENLREAFANLSPAAQRFALFLFGLKDELLALRAAAAQGVLPGFQRAITELLPALPAVEKFIGRVADAIGDLAVEAVRSFQHPVWRDFFEFIDEATVPALRTMFEVTRDVGRGLAGLFLALTPFNRSFGEGIARAAASFARWGEQLRSSADFQRFLEYVAQVTPEVVRLIVSLARAIGHLVIAAAPMGEAVVLVFTALANAIAAIPLPFLSALVGLLGSMAAAILVTVVAMRVIRTVQDSLRVGALAWAASFGKVNDEQRIYRDLVVPNTQNTSRFALAMYDMDAATRRAGRGLSGLVGVLGGPWGIALAAATLALTHFWQESAKADAAQDELVRGAREYADILASGVTPAAVDQATAVLTQNAALRGLVDLLTQAGFRQDEIVAGLNGDAQLRARVVDELNRQIQAEKLRASEARNGSDAETLASRAHRQRAEELIRLRDAFTQVNDENREGNELTKALMLTDSAYAQQIRELQAASRGWTREQFDLAEAIATVGDETRSATDRADAFMRAYDLMTSAVTRQSEAVEDYQRGLLDLEDAAKQYGTSLETNTREGLNNRDVLERVIRATVGLAAADIEAGLSIDQVNEKHRLRIKALEQEAVEAGFNRDQVKELIGQYGQVPTNVQTDFVQKGGEQLKKIFGEILSDVEYLLKYGFLPARSSERRGGAGDAFAEGGHVRGPGTSTSDSIPAWLSNGEFVQRAAAVQHYGTDFMRAINEQRIPKWALPGFAEGGLVRPLRQVPGVLPNRRPTRQEENWLEGELGFNFGLIATDIIRKQVMDEIQRRQGTTLGDQSGPGGWQWQMDVLRAVFPRLPLYSGYRPGSRTASGSLSYHAFGRAVDIPPRKDVFDWIVGNYGARTRELIWLGDANRNIHNGKFHRYSDALLRQHGTQGMPNAHIHWAYDQGGFLEPGLTLAYNGTGQPEPVLTASQWRNLNVLAAQRTQDAAGNQYYFSFQDTTLTPAKLRALQDREAALARMGRAR